MCKTPAGFKAGIHRLDPSKGVNDTGLFSLQIPRPEAFTIVSNPLGGSDLVYRYERNTDDGEVFGGWRSEIRMRNEARNREIWEYGFDTYMTSAGWPNESRTGVIFQLHTNKPSGSGVILSPAVSLQVSSATPQTFTVDVRGDARPSMPNLTPEQNEQFTLPMAFDAWIAWRFVVRYDYSGSGFVEVYRNGVKVVSYKGKVGYNNSSTINAKSGIYFFGDNPTLNYVIHQKNVQWRLMK